MRACVSIRYLATLGGGERYACAYAAVLNELGWDVDLLAPEHVPLDEVTERIRVPLDGVNLRIGAVEFDNHMSSISTEYDLMVNTTYLSDSASFASRSWLVVHFPEPDIPELLRKRLGPERVRRHQARVVPHGFGAGFWPADQRGHWCGEEGLVHLASPPRDVALALVLPEEGESAATKVTVRDPAGQVLAQTLVEAGAPTMLPVRLPDGTSTLHVGATGFVPALSRVESGQTRFAGVIVDGVYTAGSRPPPRSGRRGTAHRRAVRLTRLETYDTVTANSEFTRSWISRAWGLPSEVVYPSADSNPADGTKRDQIIAIGRFFPPDAVAHSKRQLEMVEAYKELPDGFKDRWQLVLIGGCAAAAEPYLAEVQRAAEGQNVRILPNAPGKTLVEELAASRLFWHATGLGDDEERYPERQEHFGITTIEAMASGAVPIVIDAAGQREIVRDGQDGYRWSTPAQLRELTLSLAADDERMAVLSDRARKRADDFSFDRFRERVAGLLASEVRR